MKYFKYYKYLLHHKLWVFIYCFKYGIIWRGIVHDFDKLLPYKAYHYANATFGPGRTINYGLKDGMPDWGELDKSFAIAVWKHKYGNKHHPEYWLDSGHPREMDKASVLEMLADWASANRLHRDHFNVQEWYNKNKTKIDLDPKTRRLVEYMLKKGL